MRNLHLVLGAICFFFLVISNNSFAQSLAQAQTTSSAPGGSNDPECYICINPNSYRISVKFTPDHYPFRITDFFVENSTGSFTNAYFPSGQTITNIYWGLAPTPGSGVFPSPIGNQVITANSPLLNSDGSINVWFSVDARLCLNPGVGGTFPFSLNVTISADEMKYNGIGVLGVLTASAHIPLGVTRNCDGSYPYPNPITLPSPPGEGPIMLRQGNLDLESALNLTTYPNPVEDKFLVSFELPREADVEAQIFNFSGQKVLQGFDQNSMKKGSQNLKFDFSSLPTGIYFLQLRVDDKVFSKKLIKP